MQRLGGAGRGGGGGCVGGGGEDCMRPIPYHLKRPEGKKALTVSRQAQQRQTK